VQFGLDPGRGIVLAGLSESEVGWLLTLGTQTTTGAQRDAGVLLGSATQWGVSVPRAADLVAELRGRRLVRDSPRGHPDSSALATNRSIPCGRDQPARVCVLGAGGAAHAIRDHLERLTPTGDGTGVEVCEVPGEADVTILVVAEAVGTGSASGWARSSPAHLPVVVHADRVVVGPVVWGAAGPCLRCLDHHRRDRDRAWPSLVAQVDGYLGEPEAPVHIDPVLSGVTAGLCAMVLAAFLDLGTAPEGLAWEVSLPWPRLIARRWAEHPACGHHRQRPRDIG